MEIFSSSIIARATTVLQQIRPQSMCCSYPRQPQSVLHWHRMTSSLTSAGKIQTPCIGMKSQLYTFPVSRIFKLVTDHLTDKVKKKLNWHATTLYEDPV